MTARLDADAAAVVRAAHRGGTLYQLVDRIRKQGRHMPPVRAAAVIDEQVAAGHLRVHVAGQDIYYSRPRAGSLALKAWQEGLQ